MNRTVSLYLDLVRFTAAIAVFISHISGQRFTGGLLWQSEPYGDEAVDVFVVLSGFVIAYVASRSETDPRTLSRPDYAVLDHGCSVATHRLADQSSDVCRGLSAAVRDC